MTRPPDPKLVEAVARDICKGDGYPNPDEFVGHILSRQRWQLYEGQALSAISCIREALAVPSDEMHRAASKHAYSDIVGERVSSEQLDKIYSAMLAHSPIGESE